MPSQVQFGIVNRKGSVLSVQLPFKHTLAELVAAETAAPGTLGNIQTSINALSASFQGVNKIQDGNFSGWSLGMTTPVTKVIPTIQTHEERVVITYQAEYPSAENKLHKVSVPTPDLVTDWPFPPGVARVYQEDFAATFSSFANSFITGVDTWLEDYGLNGVLNVEPLYVDLVGKNV